MARLIARWPSERLCVAGLVLALLSALANGEARAAAAPAGVAAPPAGAAAPPAGVLAPPAGLAPPPAAKPPGGILPPPPIGAPPSSVPVRPVPPQTSTAPSGRVMPNVIGMDRELAREVLQPFGLRVELPDEFRCGATPGLAWDQQPDAGTALTPNTQVRVLIAPPVMTVTVPDLLGHPQEEIAASLSKAGLCGGEQTSQQPNGTGGNVIEMKPEPGTRVVSGTPVSVMIGSATSTPSSRVPPVTTAQTPATTAPQTTTIPTVEPRRAPPTSPAPIPTLPSQTTTALPPTSPVLPPPAPSISTEPPPTPTAFGWPLVAVGAVTLLAALVLLMRSVRRRRVELPKQVRMEGRKNLVRTSVEARKTSVIRGEVEIRPVRSPATRSVQASRGLVRNEERLS